MLLEKALQLINEKNAQDPSKEIYQGKVYPKELLYCQRMYHQLLVMEPNASETLKIAVSAQHIGRWEIPRGEYPMNKVGYITWRNELKKRHASITAAILKQLGYAPEFINRVSFLIHKKALKKDRETQILEDVACLVFLQYYLEKFAQKHNKEKVIAIVKKTWHKMSEKGQEYALKLDIPPISRDFISKALQTP